MLICLPTANVFIYPSILSRGKEITAGLYHSFTENMLLVSKFQLLYWGLKNLHGLVCFISSTSPVPGSRLAFLSAQIRNRPEWWTPSATLNESPPSLPTPASHPAGSGSIPNVSSKPLPRKAPLSISSVMLSFPLSLLPLFTIRHTFSCMFVFICVSWWTRSAYLLFLVHRVSV